MVLLDQNIDRSGKGLKASKRANMKIKNSAKFLNVQYPIVIITNSLYFKLTK